MGGGGGGSSYRPSDNQSRTGGNEEGDFDCSDVSIQTNLISPDPDVVNDVDVGDVLTISIHQETEALVALYNGNIAGSISHYSYQDIIHCIERGSSYKAEVLNIKGGNYKLHITTN